MKKYQLPQRYQRETLSPKTNRNRGKGARKREDDGFDEIKMDESVLGMSRSRVKRKERGTEGATPGGQRREIGEGEIKPSLHLQRWSSSARGEWDNESNLALWNLATSKHCTRSSCEYLNGVREAHVGAAA